MDQYHTVCCQHLEKLCNKTTSCVCGTDCLADVFAMYVRTYCCPYDDLQPFSEMALHCTHFVLSGCNICGLTSIVIISIEVLAMYGTARQAIGVG